MLFQLNSFRNQMLFQLNSFQNQMLFQLNSFQNQMLFQTNIQIINSLIIFFIKILWYFGKREIKTYFILV